jgi:hypothetical protein
MKVVWISVPVLAIVLFAWFFRYEVSSGGNGWTATLDRWTGKVQRCYMRTCSPWE